MAIIKNPVVQTNHNRLTWKRFVQEVGIKGQVLIKESVMRSV